MIPHRQRALMLHNYDQPALLIANTMMKSYVVQAMAVQARASAGIAGIVSLSQNDLPARVSATNPMTTMINL